MNKILFCPEDIGTEGEIVIKYSIVIALAKENLNAFFRTMNSNLLLLCNIIFDSVMDKVLQT